MPRIRHRDHPDYAKDVMDGAPPIGPQLSVAAGLIAVLLTAMSAVDRPMQPHDLLTADAGAAKMGKPALAGTGLPCSIGDKARDWIGFTAS